MAVVGTVVARLAADLVALRPTVASFGEQLAPGRVLKIGDAHAAVLCTRGGLLMATPLERGGGGGGGGGAIREGAEASVVHGASLLARVDGDGRPGGRTFDALGRAMDGGTETVLVAGRPLLGRAPAQTELKLIERGVHTGTTAVDALTPVGRGQSMLYLGQPGSGKSSLGWDAVLAQADSTQRCVLALSSGGAERAAHVLEELRAAGGAELASRCTVVAPRGDSAAQRYLGVATALAVGEGVRDGGGHALVLADDLNGMCDLWDAAGDAVHGQPGADAADMQRSPEQRIFYAATLQRAAQLSELRGNGSLTLLALLRQDHTPPLVLDSHGAAAAGGAAGVAPAGASYSAADFGGRPAAEVSRIGALLDRGIDVDDAVLAKLGIRAPAAGGADAGGAAPAAAPPAALAARTSVLHTDQLMSLADGHVQLHLSLAKAGRRPAIRPADSLARVGAGSGGTDETKRPQPSTAAMKAVAPNLRLELAQAAQLLPPSASDDSFSSQQRARAAAVGAALTSQPEGAPLKLSEQMALLHALGAGHLDHLGEGAPVREVSDAVGALIGSAHERAAGAMAAIDATGELDAAGERALLDAAAAVLPSGTRRAFYGAYDATSWKGAR